MRGLVFRCSSTKVPHSDIHADVCCRDMAAGGEAESRQGEVPRYWWSRD